MSYDQCPQCGDDQYTDTEQDGVIQCWSCRTPFALDWLNLDAWTEVVV